MNKNHNLNTILLIELKIYEKKINYILFFTNKNKSIEKN